MKSSIFIPALAIAALGCASKGPSPELVDARRAYDNARMAPAAQNSPDRVLEAKQALDRAERAHQDDPGSFDEKSYAYIASRRADLAVLYGQYAGDLQARDHAVATYKTRGDELRRQAQGQLEQTREALNGTEAALNKSRAETAAALASLQQVGKVKEEARGTVITIDGSVLFATGKSELLPIARQKLADVAKALNDTDSDQKIVVEGYTDSNGNDDYNQRLSQARAESVRAYLVQQGVKSERITAVGKGEADPVASNDTAEGRANNRRVEIIVQNKAAASSR